MAVYRTMPSHEWFNLMDKHLKGLNDTLSLMNKRLTNLELLVQDLTRAQEERTRNAP
jgi:hypothetical protein